MGPRRSTTAPATCKPHRPPNRGEGGSRLFGLSGIKPSSRTQDQRRHGTFAGELKSRRSGRRGQFSLRARRARSLSAGLSTVHFGDGHIGIRHAGMAWSH